MTKILFVCLGNICRSPLAEGIARNYIQMHDLQIEVQSAGTGSWHIGESPCENSQIVAQNHNIDISTQKARQVNTEDFITFDYIIALDASNLRDLKQMGCNKAIKLGNYGYNGEDVPDPYFFDGFEGFEKVYSMIETSVITFLKQFNK